MARFDNGVSFYTKGIIRLSVNFPENEVKCQYCKFCRPEGELKRFWCRLTNEMIINPYYGIGKECPIIFEREDNNE